MIMAAKEIPDISNLHIGDSGLAFTPNPGTCLKTKSDTGEEIFINICHHSIISDPCVSYNIRSIVGNSGLLVYYFHHSIGEICSEKDLSGKNYQSFDVVINSGYYNNQINERRICDFIIHLLVPSIKKKFKIIIDPKNYEILNNSYHGKMRTHVLPCKQQHTNENAKMISDLIAAGAKYADFKKNNIELFSECNFLKNDINAALKKINYMRKLSVSVPIQPNQGFCAKIVSKDKKAIFINVCHHNVVPPPKSPMVDIKTTLEKEFVLGELRIGKDHSVKEYFIYDMVINSDYYHAKVAIKKEIQYFLLKLACAVLGQWYNIKVGSKITILKPPYYGVMPDFMLDFVDMSAVET